MSVYLDQSGMVGVCLREDLNDTVDSPDRRTECGSWGVLKVTVLLVLGLYAYIVSSVAKFFFYFVVVVVVVVVVMEIHICPK